LLFLHALLAPGGALEAHFIGDRRFLESRTSAEFPQDTGTFVFLLETSESPIDGFVILNNDSYHLFFIPPLRDFCVKKKLFFSVIASRALARRSNLLKEL